VIYLIIAYVDFPLLAYYFSTQHKKSTRKGNPQSTKSNSYDNLKLEIENSKNGKPSIIWHKKARGLCINTLTESKVNVVKIEYPKDAPLYD
jgi:hypothetical protein